MAKHLSVRVAWHDNYWDGSICRNPKENIFCETLGRIREGVWKDKDSCCWRGYKTQLEQQGKLNNAGKPWNKLTKIELPPCLEENSGFMKDFPHTLITPEKNHQKLAQIETSPYCLYCVPFWWMRLDSQKDIEKLYPQVKSYDYKAYKTKLGGSYIEGERREYLYNLFFNKLLKPRESCNDASEASLVVFYCNGGHPVEDVNKLVVAIGEIDKVYSPREACWGRLVEHSIRFDGCRGFVLPYLDYFKKFDSSQSSLRLSEIAVSADNAIYPEFMYVNQSTNNSTLLPIVKRLFEVIGNIQDSGIASGTEELWDKRRSWLNKWLGYLSKQQGEYPAVGSMLEVLGYEYGNSLLEELVSTKEISLNENPWEKIVEYLKSPAKNFYKDCADDFLRKWHHFSSESKQFVMLLSRFELTYEQIRRWWDDEERYNFLGFYVADEKIVENPYIIAELDEAVNDSRRISISSIDRAFFNKTPKVESVSECDITSPDDKRRIRAAVISILRNAERENDSLLSFQDIIERMESLSIRELAAPCIISEDELELLASFNSEILLQNEKYNTKTLQRSIVTVYEDIVRSTIDELLSKPFEVIEENWKNILYKTLSSQTPDEDALKEQVNALKVLSNNRFSVLMGLAGTGKTTTLGALVSSDSIEDVIALAPTGKAAVRLREQLKLPSEQVGTIHSFLAKHARMLFDPYYNSENLLLLLKKLEFLSSEADYRVRYETVIIDECSMLTLDLLVTLFKVLDTERTKRIILVGDPNQLPPIGLGKPFADICQYLLDNRPIAIASLGKNVRAMDNSDITLLSNFFINKTFNPSGKNEESVSLLRNIKSSSNVDLVFWKNSEELKKAILSKLEALFDVKEGDYDAFNQNVMGLTRIGKYYEIKPDNLHQLESFQIIAPMRNHPIHGIYSLNQLIQKTFRFGLNGNKLGESVAGMFDKVIQIQNVKLQKKKIQYFIANGDVGIVRPDKKIQFIHIQNEIFDWWKLKPCRTKRGGCSLELAYALTVHKVQGSEFNIVFLVLPKSAPVYVRELFYTALSRAKEKLVLFVEGDSIEELLKYSAEDYSKISNINSNIFTLNIRNDVSQIVSPSEKYPDGLIYETKKGELVRSKSELIIANLLFENDLDYRYEEEYKGKKVRGSMFPDFQFNLLDGEIIVWEHLGLLTEEAYNSQWQYKKEWYLKNGLISNETLFLSYEEDIQKSERLLLIIENIKSIIRNTSSE